MSLTSEQIQKLIQLVASAEADEIDCDGCFEKIAEFAEMELVAKEIPEAQSVIRQHLKQCPCCEDEFNALLDGLRALLDAEPNENCDH